MLASLGLLTITLFSFVHPAANFSGNWTLNESKSNLGGVRFNMVGGKLDVTQADALLTIVRHTQGPNGENNVTEKVTLDGKENQNKVFGETIKKSTAKWSDDGSSLTISSVIVFERDGNSTEIKSSEVWKLGSDGTLSIDFSSSSSFGDAKGTYVFTK